MSDRELQKTADYWDDRRSAGSNARAQWWDLRPINEYRNRLLSGDSAIDFEAYATSQYFDESGARWRVLSLGCGTGKLERRLAELGVVGSGLGVDIGTEGLKYAQALATEQGYTTLNYEYADLNSATLEPNGFDAVFAAGIVHHLSNLEHVFTQVAAALKPGGWFFLDEYIGPNRFQFPRKQRVLVDLAFQLIPQRYRTLRPATRASADAAARHSAIPLHALHPRLLFPKIRGGKLLDAVKYRLSLLRANSGGASAQPVLEKPRFPTAADVAAGDPSEAVRSEEIVARLKEHFEIVEMKGTGLSILQFLLADIAGNFRAENAETTELLGMLISIESALIASGELAHDFAFIAARPRSDLNTSP
jgi:SAM-dependent methyltransferase